MAQLTLGGVAIILAPIVAVPAPGPAGTFLFAFGLALVLRNSPRARRRYVRHIQHYPRIERVINFGLRRKSKRLAAAQASPAVPVVIVQGERASGKQG